MRLYVFMPCLRALFIRGTGTGQPLFYKGGERGWCTPTSNIEFPKGVKIDNYTQTNSHKDIKDVKNNKYTHEQFHINKRRQEP